MNFTFEYKGAPDGSKLFDALTQRVPLGTRAADRYGRSYRYVKASSAAALVAGNCIQSPAISANHLNLAPVANVAAEANSFSVTPGATAGVENEYAGGFLNVSVTPGLGRAYGIMNHLAFLLSTAFVLNLEKDDPIKAALTTAASKVGLYRNPYNGVIQVPVTTATGLVVGVAVSDIPASGFGWIQTWGPASTLLTGAVALGAGVVSPSAAAGAASIVTAPLLLTNQVIGYVMQLGATGETNLVDLRIRP